jgi:hypothetical protein
MAELHIDDISSKELLTKIYSECPFGGNLSVRKLPEERPLLSFGHDECIFCQFVFSGSAWQGTKGEQGIIPKDEGYGLMVSAFQSREFGFGFSLTSTQLKIINAFWQSTRPYYTEAESAMKLNGTTAKKELSESPFIIYFEYGHGIGKEG